MILHRGLVEPCFEFFAVSMICLASGTVNLFGHEVICLELISDLKLTFSDPSRRIGVSERDEYEIRCEVVKLHAGED
jgi:hypothetical protein